MSIQFSYLKKRTFSIFFVGNYYSNNEEEMDIDIDVAETAHLFRFSSLVFAYHAGRPGR